MEHKLTITATLFEIAIVNNYNVFVYSRRILVHYGVLLLEEIEAGSFDTLASLELLFLNRNPSLLTIDTSLLVNNKKLVHFTLQGNAKAFPSARDVLPACVDTCDASN
jgi:hypothetical protein